MEIRKVQIKDISEINNVCQICFGNSISVEYYCWLFGRENGFYSYVMRNKNHIIAHQAIIEKKYLYQGKDLIVGLSSGTMLLPEYQKSGNFYHILKESINNFKGDIIIGFPNENSHSIMRKLFDYKCIPHNLYQLNLNKKLEYIDSKEFDPFLRNDIAWRIDKHPLKQYKKTKKGDCNLIYKEYLGNSIDILYTNVIDNNFVDIISEFSKKYVAVNIISIHSEQLERIGFRKVDGNEFVYKAYNAEYENVIFPCQMIDSDIY